MGSIGRLGTGLKANKESALRKGKIIFNFSVKE